MNEVLNQIKSECLEKAYGYPLFKLSKTEIGVLKVAQQMLHEDINLRLAGKSPKHSAYLCILYEDAFYEYFKQMATWKTPFLFFTNFPGAFSRLYRNNCPEHRNVCSYLFGEPGQPNQSNWIAIRRIVENTTDRAVIMTIDQLIRVVWIDKLLEFNGANND